MYNKNIGRSLWRHRPVSMPASAGLYAGIGRSLCRHRPVSMPASAGLYAGIYAGMGPRGLGPNPFRLCRRTLFVFGILGVPKIKMSFFRKIGVRFLVFLFLPMLT